MKTIRELIEDGTISLDTAIVGDLPMSADNKIIGVGGQVFYAKINDDGTRYVKTCAPVQWRFPFMRPDGCWTVQDDAIRAAIAEAAAGGKK